MPVVSVNTKAIARLLAAAHTRMRGRAKSEVRARLGTAIPDKCLICQGSIIGGGPVVMCPYCGSVYHLECLRLAAESSGIQIEQATCFYCGRRMPVADVLRLVER